MTLHPRGRAPSQLSSFNSGLKVKCSNLISKRPKVGIGVLVVQNGQLLLGERIHSHGSGTWCPPGGHLEFGESPADCASRELKEETGLIATDIVPGPWTNDFFESEDKHYLTVFMFV